MEAYAKTLGIDLKVAVADADMAQQAQQVENLISQGVQVLILAPHDGAAAASLVTKCKAEGIKVVAYDRLIMNTPDLAVYVSFDNFGVGVQQGNYLAGLAKKGLKGNLIVMSGAPTDNNAKLFKDGAMSVLQPLIAKGTFKVVTDQAVDNWLPANALSIVENALTANKNNIQAILAPNDGTAGGAIQALAAQGLAGKVPITGQDAEAAAAKRILAGTQSMTIYKDTRVSAKAAVDAAIALTKGGDALKKMVNGAPINNGAGMIPYVSVPVTIVTKANIKVLTDSGYLKEADLK
jgi:D-xylose transport system substrate-binding protein